MAVCLSRILRATSLAPRQTGYEYANKLRGKTDLLIGHHQLYRKMNRSDWRAQKQYPPMGMCQHARSKSLWISHFSKIISLKSPLVDMFEERKNMQWIASGELTSGRMAVPGCGNGYEVVNLAKRGFDITAIYFAAQPVQNLRKQLLGFEATTRVVQKNIFEFERSKPFDAVYEQTCFCAITPALRSKYERAVGNWLRVGGQLFILFMQLENKPAQRSASLPLRD